VPEVLSAAASVGAGPRPEAFTVNEPVADRFSDLGVVTGRRTAGLGLVLDVHAAIYSETAGAIPPLALCSGDPAAFAAIIHLAAAVINAR
jgi:hypothetical protein